jgi:hypothetical protein
MNIRRISLPLVAALAVACGDPTGLPAALDGTWINQSVAFRFSMTLATDGNVVSGSGQWFGEACCSGPVEVSGHVDGVSVTLDMNFTATQGALTLPPPFTERFEGHLVGSDSLAGVLRAGDEVFQYGYRRSQ